ncbi:hypothetical protein [Dactylosporangium sp. CA-139066]|uniref:hypothetical protein n=1 Tax=Dactylosporangium sp. CA-139066 TaxID=3239930 RepID=UPI003D91F32C
MTRRTGLAGVLLLTGLVGLLAGCGRKPVDQVDPAALEGHWHSTCGSEMDIDAGGKLSVREFKTDGDDLRLIGPGTWRLEPDPNPGRQQMRLIVAPEHQQGHETLRLVKDGHKLVMEQDLGGLDVCRFMRS